MTLFIDIALLGFVCACCAVDVRTRRIPNVLSGSAAVIGAILNGLHAGAPGLGWSLCGIVLMVALLLPAFALGGIGGGDVKMMAAVGAFLGPRLAFFSLTAGMAVGGVVMAIHLARIGRLADKLAALRSMLQSAVLTQSLGALRVSARDADAISLPYSLPLAFGTLATVLVGRALQSATSF